MLLCGLWVHLAPPERDSPGGSRPLSIYQTHHHQHTSPVSDHGLALWLGAVYWSGRATILRREATTTIPPPPPPALCGLTLWLGAVYRSGSDPEAIIGHGFQEDAQQLVSRSEPADKIRVFPDFVGFLSDSLDLVFDQSFLCHFLQLHKNILNV